MNNYAIEKWLWTQEDYEQMGWHDATIRGIGLLTEAYELVLDIDYIFEWVEPNTNTAYYNFWISPATLIFKNINEATIDLELFDDVQLQDIVRGDSREPRNAAYIENKTEWKWTLDSNVGEISLWSVGFEQFIRRAPRLTKNQVLSLEERGGISFARQRDEVG